MGHGSVAPFHKIAARPSKVEPTRADCNAPESSNASPPSHYPVGPAQRHYRAGVARSSWLIIGATRSLSSRTTAATARRAVAGASSAGHGWGGRQAVKRNRSLDQERGRQVRDQVTLGRRGVLAEQLRQFPPATVAAPHPGLAQLGRPGRNHADLADQAAVPRLSWYAMDRSSWPAGPDPGPLVRAIRTGLSDLTCS